MNNIHEDIDTLRKEVEICKKHISKKNKHSFKDMNHLNTELQRLSKKGWAIYHREGNSGGGVIVDSKRNIKTHYHNNDGFSASLLKFQMDESTLYEKWKKNSNNFESIYLGNKKFIWIEKAKSGFIDILFNKFSIKIN